MSAREAAEHSTPASDRQEHVLILNQYIAPDTTPSAHYVSAVARALADAGMRVTVLAAEPSYGEGLMRAPLQELRDGLGIRRIRMGSWRGRRSKLRRFGGYLRYLAGAALVGRRIVRADPPDIVMCFSNPPLVPLVAGWLARRATGRMVYVIHDIHPDVLLATNWIFLPGPIVRAWNLLNHVMLEAASTVVVLGEGMKQLLVAEKGVAAERVHVIPLWAEPELQPADRDEGLRKDLGVGEDELLVLSTGNLGIMHSLEPVVDGARRLDGRPVRFVFVASGVHLDHWRARFQGLGNVSFMPYQTDESFRRLVAACDAGLVPLSPGMERFAVPSRAYTFLSAGRPLLTVMDPQADVAQLVSDSRCGFNAISGEDLAAWAELNLVSRADLQASGRRAREVYEARFTRKVILDRYVALCVRTQTEPISLGTLVHGSDPLTTPLS
jgi:glycosyltransferase involved in cell wall biosynthesis